MTDDRNLADHRVLRFREKGAKDREIPLTPRPRGLAQRIYRRRRDRRGTQGYPISSRGTASESLSVVTDLLNQNVPLEDVQYLAGPASPTTMRA
jgi:hypothetical protein